MKYRKKPVVIEATQWHKNGDHPLDEAVEMFDYPSGQKPRAVREGKMVRYFRRPDVPGESLCKQCSTNIMHDHGWIDTLEGGHIVCPDDFIITGVKGEHYPCKPEIFAMTYALAATAAPAEPGADALDAARYRYLRSCDPHGANSLEVNDDASNTIVGKNLDDLLDALMPPVA